MTQSKAHPQPSNHHIPGDVLLQVFEELSGRRTGEWEPAPWTLAIVCRRWRDLVILSPTLWTQLTFSTKNRRGDLPVDDYRSQKERLEVHLARAGRCTLELKIDVTSVPQVNPPETLEDAFRLLVSNISRCTRLELGGRIPLRWSLASGPSDEEPPSLPALQSLSILHRSWIAASKAPLDRSSSEPPVKPFFRITPSLRSLTLHGGNFALPTFGQNFQLENSNLQCLVLRHCHFDPANILPILETCAYHLRELTIEHGSPLSHPSPHQAIELPRLRRLGLVHLYSDPPLMDHIETPRLEYARLTGVSTRQRDTLAMLNSVVRSNSATSIKELVFESCLYEPCAPLIALLGELKELDTLIVRQVIFEGGNDPLLVGLRQDDSSSPLPLPNDSNQTFAKICPKLRRLELGYMTLDSRLLEDMVQSRVIFGNERLEELYLEYITLKESNGEGDLQWLQDMVQQGCLKTSERETWVA